MDNVKNSANHRMKTDFEKKLFIFRGKLLTFFLYFRQLNKRTNNAYWHCYRSPPVLFFWREHFLKPQKDKNRTRTLAHFFPVFFSMWQNVCKKSQLCTKSAAHTHTLPHLLYTFSGLSQPAYPLRNLHCWWTRLIYIFANALVIAFEFVIAKIVTKKHDKDICAYVHLRRARTDLGWLLQIFNKATQLNIYSPSNLG